MSAATLEKAEDEGYQRFLTTAFLWYQIASSGRIVTTGSDATGEGPEYERALGNPLVLGRLYGYSEVDIAYFFVHSEIVRSFLEDREGAADISAAFMDWADCLFEAEGREGADVISEWLLRESSS